MYAAPVLGAEVIGQHIKVYWEEMGGWYDGVIVAYKASTGEHRVLYTDKDLQYEDLQETA